MDAQLQMLFEILPFTPQAPLGPFHLKKFREKNRRSQFFRQTVRLQKSQLFSEF